MLSLYADGVKIGDFSATAGALSKTWTGLPANANGTNVVYDVREDSVPAGYAASVVTNGPNSFTVFNKHEPERVSVAVSKVWDDGENRDGLRPESLPLVVSSADGSVAVTTTVTAASAWTADVGGLYARAPGGLALEYAVSEPEVPDGYELAGLGATTVTNRHLPSASLSGVVWNDANANGVRQSGEALLSGVAVAVSGPGGFSTNLVTDASGAWSVSGLWRGEYAVAVSLPRGCSFFSPRGQGADRALDSDVSAGSGTGAGRAAVTLAAGASAAVDAGASSAQPGLSVSATWTLDRSTGLFTSVFTLRNAGNAPYPVSTQFWAELADGSNPVYQLYSSNKKNALAPKLPDGRRYYDLTSAIRAKLGSSPLAAGASVSVTGPCMYHVRRYNPGTTGYFSTAKNVHAGTLFLAQDSNKDFKISASEYAAALAAWRAGNLDDAAILLLSALSDTGSYIWDDALKGVRRY